MKKRPIDDSAREPDMLKELDDVKGTPTEDKIVEFIEKTKKVENVNVTEKVSNIEEITKADISNDKTDNKLLVQWQNRQKKDIPNYTDVVLLVETPFYDWRDYKKKKIPAGQVGRVAGVYTKEKAYEITFSHNPPIIEELVETVDDFDEVEIYISIGISRNKLLVLDNNPNFKNEEVQLLKFDVNKDLKKEISLSEIQMKTILKEELKYVNKTLPSHYKNNLKPGKLVTIITDFMVDTKYEYIVKIHAGQIGLILDPSTDEFTTQKKKNQNKLSEVNQNPSSKLKEDEILVYFSDIPLWYLFRICNENYKGLTPFESDQCYILNKAFLLPLCFELSED